LSLTPSALSCSGGSSSRQHEYIIKIESERIELLQIVPAAVSQGDPEVDA
jgi:hypothetical protein